MVVGLFHNGNEGELPDDEFGLFGGIEYGANREENRVLENGSPRLLEAFYDADSLVKLLLVNTERGSYGAAKGEAHEVLTLIDSVKKIPEYNLSGNAVLRRKLDELGNRARRFIDVADLVYSEVNPIFIRPS